MNKSEQYQYIYNYIHNNYTDQEYDEFLKYMRKTDDYTLFDDIALEEWESLKSEMNDTTLSEREKLRKEALLILEKQKNNMPRKTKKQFTRWIPVACSILIIVSIFLFFLYKDKQPDPNDQILSHQVESISGKSIKEISLPDGSQVCLNSETRFLFPESFDKERKVKLTGEAFFNIKKDKNKPFTIQTDAVSVEVLGTSFNVKNYENDKFMSVTVSSGRVRITTNDRIQIVLNPGEQLTINKQNGLFDKKQVNAEKYSSWQEGTLYFDETPIQDVVNTLSRHYDADIILEGNFPNCISGEHDNKSMESILESIRFVTGIKHKKSDGIIILYK